MTGWGDWDMCAHTNPEAQWCWTEWKISQIRKALHSSAHSFHLLAALSGSLETLPVTQHQRCHQQHDTVPFIPVTTLPALYLNVHQPHLSVQPNRTAGGALGSSGPFFLSRFLVYLSSLMAGAHNRTEELEDFTHNLIRGDLCVTASYRELGAGLFLEGTSRVSVIVWRRSITPLSVQKSCGTVAALAPGSSAKLGIVDQDLRKCVLTRHHFYLMWCGRVKHLLWVLCSPSSSCKEAWCHDALK